MTPHFNFFPSLNTRNIPEFNCESINDNYNESNKISGINMVGVTHTSIQATYFFFFRPPQREISRPRGPSVVPPEFRARCAAPAGCCAWGGRRRQRGRSSVAAATAWYGRTTDGRAGRLPLTQAATRTVSVVASPNGRRDRSRRWGGGADVSATNNCVSLELELVRHVLDELVCCWKLGLMLKVTGTLDLTMTLGFILIFGQITGRK